MTIQSEEKKPETKLKSETGKGEVWIDETGVGRHVAIYETVDGGVVMEFKRGDRYKHVSLSQRATEALTELLIRRNNLC